MGRAANDMLSGARLHPEHRRVIGHVRQHRDERRLRLSQGQAVVQRAVEVRNQRDHHVGLRLAPVSGQPLHQQGVTPADGALQQLELLRETQREATGQALVVEVFGIEAHDAAEPTRRVDHFGEVHLAHTPRQALGLDGQ
ncbi:hypothetical protein FQZ97_811640 [compost metagenome]